MGIRKEIDRVPINCINVDELTSGAPMHKWIIYRAMFYTEKSTQD